MSQFTSKKLSEVYVDVDINCVVIVYLMIEPTSVFKLPDLLMDYKEKIVIREKDISRINHVFTICPHLQINLLSASSP